MGQADSTGQALTGNQRTRVVAVGEVMVEMARGADNRFGMACGGDTFNTAVYLARAGIDLRYEAVDVPSEALEATLAGLRGSDGAGNVTVPHKEAAFAAAAVRDPSAVAVGAANTLWLENGQLHAANTDTYGFMRHLSVSAPGCPIPRSARRIIPARTSPSCAHSRI